MWGRLCHFPQGYEALVLGMATPMSTIHIHSGLHSFRAPSVCHRVVCALYLKFVFPHKIHGKQSWVIYFRNDSDKQGGRRTSQHNCIIELEMTTSHWISLRTTEDGFGYTASKSQRSRASPYSLIFRGYYLPWILGLIMVLGAAVMLKSRKMLKKLVEVESRTLN